MIDYLKANHLVLILIGYLVFSSVGGVSFGAYDATTNTNPQIYEDTVSIRGNATVGNASTDAHTLTGDLTINTDDFVLDASSDTILIGTTTSSGSDVAIVDAVPSNGNAASTTIKIGDSSTTTSRAQFEMKQVDGGVSCIMVNSAGTAFTLVDGACNQ